MLLLPIEATGEVLWLSDDAAGGRAGVALARPRLARDRNGRPRLRLRRWIPTSDGNGGLRLAAGRLDLDVEVAPTAAELTREGLDPEKVRPMPWLDATVRLEAPGLDPVDQEVSIAAGAVGVLSADLTDHQASVLAPLLEREITSPLQVTWTGHVKVRLPPVEITAAADSREVRRRVEAVRGAARSVVARAILDASARIEIDGSAEPELERALRQWVLDELARRLEAGEDLVVRASASDVVSWPIRLATTLDAFPPTDERWELVQNVILDPSEMGSVPPIEVRTLGDFSGPLERVDVRLQATGAGEAADIALTDDEPRSVRLGTTSFRWKYRLKLAFQSPSEWSSWQSVGGSTSVVVPVSTPPHLVVEVFAAGLDFEDRWRSVRVELEHSAMGSPPIFGVVELDASRRSAIWSAELEGARGPISGRVIYLSQRGLTVERRIEGLNGDAIGVGDPFDGDCVRVALIPTGSGWQDVALAMVDLRHRDGREVFEETVEVRGLDDFVQWTAPARHDGPREVEWRCHASYIDGRFEQSDWRRSAGSVLAIPLVGKPRREIKLLPIFFDAARARRLEVRLESGDRIERIEITDTAARMVELPPGRYRYGLSWYLADGTLIQVGEREADDDVIVLPRPPAS